MYFFVVGVANYKRLKTTDYDIAILITDPKIASIAKYIAGVT